MHDFSGKTVLVTGAAGNLGRTVAAQFHSLGASLVLTDISLQRLQEVHTAWAGDDSVLFLEADLVSGDATQSMIDQAHQRFGSIDVLANITGGFAMGPKVHETTEDDWDRMQDMNARTMYHCCRSVIPFMLTQGHGKIVSVSARAAEQGKGGMGPYCVSKHAVITLTQTLAAEHRHDNININCILPGTIDTPENRKAMPSADHDTWVSTNELASVIVFLASEAARAVNGAAVPVYGRS